MKRTSRKVTKTEKDEKNVEKKTRIYRKGRVKKSDKHIEKSVKLWEDLITSRKERNASRK